MRLRVRGTSAYLIRGEGTVLVDTGAPGGAKRIVKKLRKNQIDTLNLIVVTHGHIHSFGSAKRLHELTGAPVAIHKEDAYALMQGRSGAVRGSGIARVGAFFSNTWAAIRRTKGMEPDLLIQNTMSLRPYGVQASVIMTPGHTAGSVSVITDDGELISGGMLRKRRFSRQPVHAKLAENPNQMALTINRIILMRPKKLCVPNGLAQL